MKIGALVAKKLRWSLNSNLLGVVVGISMTNNKLLIVLWNKNGVYKIQEHLSDALIDVDDYPDEVLKTRTCISV